MFWAEGPQENSEQGHFKDLLFSLSRQMDIQKKITLPLHILLTLLCFWSPEVKSDSLIICSNSILTEIRPWN